MTFNLFDMGNGLNATAFNDTVNGTASKIIKNLQYNGEWKETKRSSGFAPEVYEGLSINLVTVVKILPWHRFLRGKRSCSSQMRLRYKNQR